MIARSLTDRYVDARLIPLSAVAATGDSVIAPVTAPAAAGATPTAKPTADLSPA